ncbi:MAG: MFS transporter [Desulfobacteraceae bacterium]|nr:MFS transporter [Desulfobacteraceae bacterium]
MYVIIFILLMHSLRHGMVSPLIPLFAQKMGCSGAMIGAAVGSFSILSLLMALPIGNLSDRVNTRILLLLGAFCNFIYSLLLLLSKSIWVLISVQMLGGLGFLLLLVSSQTWISKHSEKRIRERGFGVLSLAAAIGQTIGPFIGGLVLSRTSFVMVFSLAAFFSLSGFSAAGLRNASKVNEKNKGQINKYIRKSLMQLITDRKMCAVFIFTFIAVFAAELRNSFVPVLLKTQEINEFAIGILISIFAFSMVLIRLVIGRVMGMVSRWTLLGLALSFFFIATTTIPLISKVWILGIIMFLFGIGYGISQPLSMVMISDRARVTSGLSMGVRFFVHNLATLFSPLLTGLVVGIFNIGAAFYCVAALLFASAVLIWLLANSGV